MLSKTYPSCCFWYCATNPLLSYNHGTRLIYILCDNRPVTGLVTYLKSHKGKIIDIRIIQKVPSGSLNNNKIVRVGLIVCFYQIMGDNKTVLWSLNYSNLDRCLKTTTVSVK